LTKPIICLATRVRATKKGKAEMLVQLQSSETRTITSRLEFIGRVVILAIALLLLTRNVTGLFIGWHDWNSSLYSYFARNHIQYGLGYTKLFNTWGDTLTPPANPHRYLNHPPLLAVWAAIPMFFFGDHEWVGRSVPITTTLAGVWLLMVIVSRLQSPLLGLLSGLFYATLPVTAFFGRMLDPESPVQFFSLLMLHGYLQWAGLYGNGYRRAPGVVYYTFGVVLGIWTGWAAVIMAGLIWLWHLCRTFGDSSLRRLILWLTLIPAASLAAVIVHIAWGCNWNITWLGHLLLSRTVSPREPVTWTMWLLKNWKVLRINVSAFGIGAGIVYLAILPVVLRYTASDSPFRQIVHSKTSVTPILLTALYGLLWVCIFRHQSWMHDYWQYYTAPFFATAMASVVLAAPMLLAKSAPRAAIGVALLLVILPMPSFAGSLDLFYRKQNPILRDTVTTFKELSRLIPPKVPVMISEELLRNSESLGSYTNYYWLPSQLDYYADRPLIYSADINEIQANRQGCAAYIMFLTNDPNLPRLAQQLNARYKLAWAQQNFLIFLLNQKPKDN
jgi:4-amino-4-deoxy-L-arabinose transferase-like glycosyltransferase